MPSSASGCGTYTVGLLYDGRGNVLKHTAATPSTTTLSITGADYDAQDRVVSYGVSPASEPCNAGAVPVAYDRAGRVHKQGATTYTYDDAVATAPVASLAGVAGLAPAEGRDPRRRGPLRGGDHQLRRRSAEPSRGSQRRRRLRCCLAVHRRPSLPEWTTQGGRRARQRRQGRQELHLRRQQPQPERHDVPRPEHRRGAALRVRAGAKTSDARKGSRWLR